MIGDFRRSTGRKLTLVVLAATLVALAASAAALLFFDARAYRDTWTADFLTQADILARTTASALAFDDRQAAQENLEFLSARPNVVAAAIYSASGEPFARYEPQGIQARPDEFRTLEASGSTVLEGAIYVYAPIVQDGQALGAVYLRGSYFPRERLAAYAKILAVVMLSSLVLAGAITLWLQGSVTGPIRELTHTARRVMEQRDFSLRATKTTEDEVGVLVAAFNAMLAEVERNANALQEADRLKDEFLATLAHELRNPLAPLSNGLELLRVTGADPVRLAAVREMMQRQLSQLVRLVDDLLDVSRITTGRLVIRGEPLDLRAAIDSAIEISRPLIQSRKHRFTQRVEAGALDVNGDATRLAQVFSNLLNNAARYTPEGGSIELCASRENGWIEVRVSDSGLGLTTENVQAIFGMFVQVDRSLERTNAGLGVGLSLAKRLVELHGGSISAQSEGPGRGSTFIVRLPALDHPARRLQAPAASTEGASAPRRILLADDNVDFLTGFEIILKQQGHDVRVVHDGTAALESAQRFAPEFAFLDIGLPGVNGYEVARRLRDAPATRECVLTAVTGWGQQADRERARAAGFDFHCVKPVDYAQIAHILRCGRETRAAEEVE